MAVKIQGLLDYDAVQCCSRIPLFWRTLLPSLHPKVEAARSSKMLASYCNTTQCHNTLPFFH